MLVKLRSQIQQVYCWQRLEKSGCSLAVQIEQKTPESNKGLELPPSGRKQPYRGPQAQNNQNASGNVIGRCAWGGIRRIKYGRKGMRLRSDPKMI
jgi:hypothetical protein